MLFPGIALRTVTNRQLIRCIEGAHNALLDLEELDEDDLDRVRKDYRSMAERARLELRNRRVDTGTWELSGKARPTKAKKTKRR